MRAEIRAGEQAVVERRGSNRFLVQEELRYRAVDSAADKVFGVGRTLDMSSSGILFTSDGSLQPGRTIELSVNWPARLDGRCALKLVAVGRVVRSGNRCTAIRIDRYEFRTRKLEPEAAVA
jgi:hypothetical protein